MVGTDLACWKGVERDSYFNRLFNRNIGFMRVNLNSE